jgi:hypothetical protein
MRSQWISPATLAPLPSVSTESSRPIRRSILVHAGIFALVALGLALGPGPDLALAHAPSASRGSSDADTLTQDLVTMSARYQGASGPERRRLEGALVTKAAARLQILARLIESDPGAVLAAALPAAVRAGLPPAASAHLEQDTELEGALEILHEDWPGGSRYEYFLASTRGRHSLHFAEREPDHLLSGATIRVRGARVGTALALGGGGSTVHQVAPAPQPSTLGEQRTLVILVNFSDSPTQPYTPADARAVVFTTTSNFYLENSFQQTWLAGDVVGWFTIAATSTACDTDAIATQARSAAVATGVNLAAYAHHVYAFPQNYNCYFWGRSTVGGNPSYAWINGDFELGVTAHEFGHGLGLWHSHSMDCGTATLGSSCTPYEYGDTLDMMGASSFAHFNPFQKERLGWLNAGISPPITTVQTGGTYALESYELAGSGPKALKILKSTDPSTGNRTWYYVQSRQAIGFDAGLAGNANVLSGVLIHFGTESSGNSSYLIDLTPESGSSIYLDWSDPALVVGQSFADPNAGVTMTTEWVTATKAAVTVHFEATVTVSTDKPSYTRNQSVSITARATSGGSPVANAVVSFAVAKSNGAVVTATATTGTNGAAVYKLRLGQQDPVGTYQAGVVVTKGAMSRSATTNFTVR